MGEDRRINIPEVTKIFEQNRSRGYATSPHLDTIKALASKCETATEFGVRQGATASALVLGVSQQVYGYDIKETPRALELAAWTGGKLEYVIQNTIADDFRSKTCDLIFFDSLHTYRQLQIELIKHANNAKKYLLFHDTITFGIHGADGETGKEIPGFVRGVFNSKVHGIRLAIDEYMVLHPEWKIKFHHPHSHGLLCLERR